MYEIKQGPIHKESVIINPYMRGKFFYENDCTSTLNHNLEFTGFFPLYHISIHRAMHSPRYRVRATIHSANYLNVFLHTFKLFIGQSRQCFSFCFINF